MNGWSGPKGNIGRKKYSIKERKTGEKRRSTSKKMEGEIVKGKRDDPPFFT